MRAQQPASKPAVPALRIYVLGRFLIERDGEPLSDAAWERRKARALLKLLAIAPGQRMHVEQIQDLLWPEHEEPAANNNFRRTLHMARHALEPELASGRGSAYLRLGHDVLSLDTEHTWIDAVAMEEAANRARSTRDGGAFEQAIALYAGELLPEDRNEDWAVEQRDVLARIHIETLIEFAEMLEQLGRSDDAVTRLQQVIERERAHEEAHRSLMRLYALSGERHRALRQYQACKRALHEEVDAEPEPETEQLYADIRAGTIGRSGAQVTDRPITVLPPALLQVRTAAFVGRERALDVMLADPMLHPDDADAHPSDQRRATLLIAGEAGVGKTRLLAEAGRQTAGRGALVLWGTGYESEGRLPYAPFVEALDRHVANVDAAERSRLAGELPELGRLLPSLTALVDPVARGQLQAEIVRYLTDLATTTPLMLVIDDLHAVDSASLQLFHQLARLAPERAWTLVGAYREENAPEGSELHRTVLSLERAECVREIHLLRLGHSDCDRLVRALLPEAEPDPELLARLYALSLGNPLFVGELVRTMREEETLRLTGGRWEITQDGTRPMGTSIPERIRDLVLSQVDALGKPTADLMTIAAVAGMESSFDLLVGAMGQLTHKPARDDVVLDALDRALEAQLLHEREGGYVFRHPLFPEAIYRRVTGPRRARLHLALGQALEERSPESVEGLAYHFTRSGEREKALLYLERSADRARLFYAHDLAIQQYREALALLAPMEREADEARYREHLALTLLNTDRRVEAIPEYEHAARFYEGIGDLPGLARSSAGAVECDITAHGYGPSQIARLRGVIETLEAAGDHSSGLGLLYSNLMAGLYLGREYAAAAAASERAVELVRADKDPTWRGRIEMEYAFIHLVLDRHREARTLLQEIIPWCESHGYWRSASIDLMNLGETYRLDGCMSELVKCGRRGLEASELTDSPRLLAEASSVMGGFYFYAGDWPRARRVCDRATELVEKLYPEGPGYMVQALLPGGALAFAEGRWDDASRVLETVVKDCGHGVDPRVYRDAQILLAERDRVEGRPREAFERLEPLPGRAPGLEGHAVCVAPHAALCHLALGDIARAEEIMTHILPRARSLGMLFYMPEVLAVHGLVQAHLGHRDEAAAACREAVDTARSMPCPWLEARCLLTYSRTLRELGDTAASRGYLGDAATLLQALGGSLYFKRVVSTL